MTSRSCNKCKIVKPLPEFTKMSSNKNGRGAICILCNRARGKEYADKNRDKKNSYSKKRYYENLEKNRQRCIESNRKRTEKIKIYKKEYDKRKPDFKCKNEAKRRALKLRAMPKWLSEEQLQRIADIYKKAAEMTKETGIQHAVDHIIPLQGKTVCGFHHPDNLRVITAEENAKKNNKLLEELL